MITGTNIPPLPSLRDVGVRSLPTCQGWACHVIGPQQKQARQGTTNAQGTAPHFAFQGTPPARKTSLLLICSPTPFLPHILVAQDHRHPNTHLYHSETPYHLAINASIHW